MKDKNKVIPVAQPFISKKELAYVTECIQSGWISSLGKYILAFEEAFSNFCQARYGIATSNGTTALHLALATLGIGPGDEVIVPTLTFIATANAVTYTGAKPVFVDAEARTWNIDPAKIEAKITKRTKAIIPVHLYGHPADMGPILKLAKGYKLWVIEDAAEAHGALYREKKVGSLGDLACFSFYGNKIITTGEGGMIVTSGVSLAKKAKWLRDHGMSKTRRYWHPVIGYNYRITNIQAAIGLAQLEKIEEMICRKRENAKLYNSLLRDIPGITLPPEERWAQNVYWMYSILVEKEFGLSRDLLSKRLREKGIDSRPFFHPIHTMPPYKTKDRLPVAEVLARKGLSLPSSVLLKSKEIKNIARVIEELSPFPKEQKQLKSQ